MPLFTKKPVTIEAHQFDGTPENALEILKWYWSYSAEDVAIHASSVEEVVALLDNNELLPEMMATYSPNPVPTLTIPTLEGAMQATVGYWIIRGVKNEFYPCKPDIFEMTYSTIPEPPVETCNLMGCTYLVGHETKHPWEEGWS